MRTRPAPGGPFAKRLSGSVGRRGERRTGAGFLQGDNHMLTHPDFVLQATRDRQERINADVHALQPATSGAEPGKVRRTVGEALITLGERVGGRATREPSWASRPHTRARLV